MPKPRNRLLYLIAVTGVVLLGLASRRLPGLFPRVLDKYPGDILWTVMVFLGLGVLFPRATSLRLAAGALAISWVVELTQLYQAPWINGVRRTTMGHLVLGSTFAWLDLVSYAAGAGLALGGEWAIRWLFRAHRSPPVMIL